MEPTKPKPKKYRLKATRSLVAETLAMLDKIAADENQAPSKRAVAVFTRADLVATLLASESSEARARLKANVDTDDEPEEPKKPLVPLKETDAVRAFKERIKEI